MKLDSTVLNFLLSVSSGIVANVSSEGLKSAYLKILAARPDIAKRMTNPSSVNEVTETLAEIAGELEALANTGQITVDRATIQALRSATFNHQDGLIHIGNSHIQAPTLHTGGVGKGKTVIGSNTVLSSAGTSIQIGHGASIVMSGNAGIRQS
jgi:hypothetical protein